jgi:hypothetical protein
VVNISLSLCLSPARARGGEDSRFGRVIPGGKNLRYPLLSMDPRGILDMLAKRKIPTLAFLVMRYFAGYKHVVYRNSAMYNVLQV